MNQFKSPEMDPNRSTITLTFGDRAENHARMQTIGTQVSNGFTGQDLYNAKQLFEKQGVTCELYDLTLALPEQDRKQVNNEAYLLVVRKGVNIILQDEKHTGQEGLQELWKEQVSLNHDKQAFMYGKVVNKHARYNLCFSTVSQEPNYNEKKGRIVAFQDIPLTNRIKTMLPVYLGEKANGLVAEGNYYFDIKNCGIGWHGDTERKRVVGIRLGASMPLYFQWYYQRQTISERMGLMLDDGDLYVMSEKTVGFDWKRPSILTLRHAAGAAKFTKFGK